MSGHDATARRRADGWSRWYAACADCPWKADAHSRGEAEALAEMHHDATAVHAVEAVANTWRCSCWHDTEYTDLCPKHQILDALGRTA